MGRPSTASSGPIEPADWPDWVLAFAGGFQTTDPRRQAARMIEFRTWRTLRADWFAKHGIEDYSRVCGEERRRRAAVWQETHAEDRGPTFHRAKG
jgi:hypothetical protein